LLETRKANINTQDTDDWAPLIHTLRNGNEAVVKLLLENEKVYANLGPCFTPLKMASEEGKETVVKHLFESRKADVNFRGDRSPLLVAVWKANKAVSYYLKLGRRI
jgi:ankyrin repeat protein